ncbi:MAG: energy-coupling factor transporter transmembrane component T family protein [Pseudoclavibacter sp.]
MSAPAEGGVRPEADVGAEAETTAGASRVPPELLETGTRFIDRVNAVTPFGAAVVYTLPLLVTIDAVSALVALAATLVLLACAGVGPRRVLRRAWPMLIAAPVAATSMLLYAAPGGRSYGSFLLAEITDNSIELAVAIGLRVLAVGVPTLALLGGIDTTRLADGLAQVVRLPSRFVLGALAGVRLFAVFGDEWESLVQARRARGLGDRHAIARGFGMAFALLVLAVRRGGALATAMEARGFGAGRRTWARPSRLGVRDAVVIGFAVLVPAAALAIAVATGSFRLIGVGS